MRALGSFIVCAALASGCASPGGMDLRNATRSELVARAGYPSDIRFDRNGDELWEYATGPSGFDTHVIRFARDGKVGEATQVLTQERLNSIVIGQATKADVRHILGRPSEISFPRSGETWSWRFMLGGLQPGYLAVAFHPDGTVRDRMVVLDASGDQTKDD